MKSKIVSLMVHSLHQDFLGPSRIFLGGELKGKLKDPTNPQGLRTADSINPHVFIQIEELEKLGVFKPEQPEYCFSVDDYILFHEQFKDSFDAYSLSRMKNGNSFIRVADPILITRAGVIEYPEIINSQFDYC